LDWNDCLVLTTLTQIRFLRILHILERRHYIFSKSCFDKTQGGSSISIFHAIIKCFTALKTRIRENTLEAIGSGKDFLSRTQVAQQLRERINKWDYMKLKSFCTTKKMDSKLKRPPTEWEKIFASYTSDKWLMRRIYKELK
jgi:hypothetical protein